MKKLLALLMAVAVTFQLVTPVFADTEGTEETTAPTEAVVETKAPTEAPAEETTVPPEETKKFVDGPSLAIEIYGETTLLVGQSMTLMAAISPETSSYSLSWESSSPDVATVDASGTVYGVSAGTTVISVQIQGTEVSASTEISVTELSDPVDYLRELLKGCAYTAEISGESLGEQGFFACDASVDNEGTATLAPQVNAPDGALVHYTWLKLDEARNTYETVEEAAASLTVALDEIECYACFVAYENRGAVAFFTISGEVAESNQAAAYSVYSSESFSPLWPVKQSYYIRALDTYNGGSEHGGIDIISDGYPTQDVFAVADGTVVSVYNDCPHFSAGAGEDTCGQGWGNNIQLKHVVNGTTYYSRYAHLTQNSITVNVGDSVEAGSKIAKMGSSGSSTAPHLHLEITPSQFPSKDIRGRSFDYYMNNTAFLASCRMGFATGLATNSPRYGAWILSNCQKESNGYYYNKHIHNYETQYESVHPHREYEKCDSCGDWHYTNSCRTITVDGCIQCEAMPEQWGVCGDNLVWKIEGPNGHKTITISGTGDMWDFQEWKGPWQVGEFRRVIVCEGATSIGNYAFSFFVLEYLRLPSTLMRIGDGAFYNCDHGILGPLALPSSLKIIGENAFYGCRTLTGDLIIPDTVTSIGAGAFFDCSGFNGRLVLPKNLIEIEDDTFEQCGFTGNLILPDNLRSIGKDAFSCCSGFTGGLTFPETLETIGDGAFESCSGLTGTLVFPDNLRSIGARAFFLDKGFTGALSLPESLTAISEMTFGRCSGFTGDLILPDGITTIGSGAFAGCTGFTGTLKLPTELEEIDEGAFANCSGFTVLEPLPKKLVNIGNMAFYDCSGFTGRLMLPDSLEIIGDDAFYNCSNFTECLVLPGHLKTIGATAFFMCDGFTGSLVIPSSLTAIGSKAFFNSGITSLTILNDSLSLEVDSFCLYNLKSLTAPGELEVYTNLFQIEKLTLTGTRVKHYGKYERSAEEVIISEGVTEIEAETFASCIYMRQLTLPQTLCTIGMQAFEDCPSLEDVYYSGSETNWTRVNIGRGNEDLTNAIIHYGENANSPEIRPVDIDSMVGGSKLPLSAWSNGKKVNVKWNVSQGDEDYVSISNNGVLTAKTVDAVREITVIATPSDGSPKVQKTIQILPQVKEINLLLDGEPTLNMLDLDLYDTTTLDFFADTRPEGAMTAVSWTSNATKVASVDENGRVVLRNPGTAVIQAMAKDGSKKTARITLNVIYTDYSPRLEASTLSLNTASTAGVDVALVESYGNAIEKVTVDDARFRVSYENNLLTLSAREAVARGNYAMTLETICGNGRTYTYPITVRASQTLPRLTVRQSQRFNLFYRDSQAALTITGGEVESAELIGNSDFVLENEDGEWVIRYADPENAPAKPSTRATLSVSFAGYNIPVTRALTIGTVNTAPKLKLNPTSSTLNTALNSDWSVETVLSGADGESLYAYTDTPGVDVALSGNVLTLTLAEAKSVSANAYVQDDNWTKPVKLTHRVTVTNRLPTLRAAAGTLKLNSWFPSETASTGMILSQGNVSLTDVELTPAAREGTAARAESDKLNVYYDADSGEIVAEIADPGIKNGTYSFACTGILESGTEISGGTVRVTVSNTLPRARLSAAMVRLNRQLAGEENIAVKVTLTGGDGYTIEGFEELPDCLDYADGILTATIPNADFTGGSYVLNAIVSRNGETATLPAGVILRVQVYDRAPSFRLTAKGKLDVLNPVSEIIYTPRLTNAQGTVTDIRLKGADAELFAAEVVDGVVHLTMAKGCTYSTRTTYKVIPVLTFCGQEVTGSTLSIRVTQSTVKLAKLSNRTVYQSQTAPLVQVLSITSPATAEFGEITLNSRSTAALRNAVEAAGGIEVSGEVVRFPAKAFASLKPGRYTVILDVTPGNAAADAKPIQARFTLTVQK